MPEFGFAVREVLALPLLQEQLDLVRDIRNAFITVGHLTRPVRCG